MTTIEMDRAFADALRAALVDHVTTAPAVRRRRRWHRAVGSGIGLVLVGGGVAVAQGILPLPGGDVVTDLSHTVTVTRTGTSTVELGDPPGDVTSIELELTCLSPGSFTYEDGASMLCSTRDVDEGLGTSWYTLPLAPGQHTTTITTSADAQWTLTASYSRHAPTGWATNANGDTYGIANDQGEPDLVAVIATSGRQGYAYRTDLAGPMPTSPEQAVEWSRQDAGQTHTIPVYESDGTTKIGEFVVGGVARTGVPAPQPQLPSSTP